MECTCRSTRLPKGNSLRWVKSFALECTRLGSRFFQERKSIHKSSRLKVVAPWFCFSSCLSVNLNFCDLRTKESLVIAVEESRASPRVCQEICLVFATPLSTFPHLQLETSSQSSSNRRKECVPSVPAESGNLDSIHCPVFGKCFKLFDVALTFSFCKWIEYSNEWIKWTYKFSNSFLRTVNNGRACKNQANWKMVFWRSCQRWSCLLYPPSWSAEGKALIEWHVKGKARCCQTTFLSMQKQHFKVP